MTLLFTVAAAVAARALEPETFRTIGDGGWWALQTVSTVGYGDSVPESSVGKMLGAVLMLVGVAFVPALTSIVVAVLIARVQAERDRSSDRQAEIVERLDRLERALADRRGHHAG